MFLNILILHCFTFICYAQEMDSDICTHKYCYDLDFNKDNRFRFGTKAPYPRYTDFDINQEFQVPKCEPVKMWLIVRHGARLPTRTELDDFRELVRFHNRILQNYQNISEHNRCKLCNADFEILKRWTYKHKITNLEANHLVPEGFKDMVLLSKSLAKMFPTLFDAKYAKHSYLFGLSREHRTRYSFFGFIEGLFGKNSYRNIPFPQTYLDDQDLLLQPYSQCNHSIDNAKFVDKRRQQAYQFTKSDAFMKLMTEVSQRLGFKRTLRFEWIKSIWDWCKYEQGWHPLEPSPWCSAFLPHHFQYLEYYDDLKFYYKKAYGTPLTIKLTCATMNNMLYYLESDDSFKVVAYFVHSTLMQLFHTSLGFFKDSEHLRGDNYEKMTDRLFKSSINLPLSSNLAVVKYKCSGKTETTKVMFLINQKPVKLSWCHHNGLCDLNEVKKQYLPFAQLDCNTSYCDIDFTGFESSTSNNNKLVFHVPLAIIFVSILCTIILRCLMLKTRIIVLNKMNKSRKSWRME